MAEIVKLPGDDLKTGKFVLLVDTFRRAIRNDRDEIVGLTTHNRGERLHLTDADAERLLNTDPPAVKLYGTDDPVTPRVAGVGAAVPGGDGSNEAWLREDAARRQAQTAADARAVADISTSGIDPVTKRAAIATAQAKAAKNAAPSATAPTVDETGGNGADATPLAPTSPAPTPPAAPSASAPTA